MRISFNNWSIKYKITLLITTVFLMAFIGLSVFIYYYSKQEFDTNAQNQIKLISRVLGESNSAAILFKDADAAKKSLGIAHLIQELTQVEILDQDTQLVAKYQAKDAKEFINLHPYYRVKRDTILELQNFFIDIHPIVFEKDTIGKVIVTHDKRFFQDKFNKYIAYQFLIFFIIFLVAFSFILLLQRFITRPIKSLITTMKSVTTNNDYSIRLHPKGKDELGEMMEVFDHMLAHIETQSNELIKSKEKAVNLAGAKDKFLAQMSHEIRTPLNAIFGFITLFGKTELTPDQKIYLGYVKSSLENLGGIINDVLDFSKIEAGKLVIGKKEFNLTGMLEDLVHVFEPKAKEKNLELKLSIGDEVPKVIVADKLRLNQVFVNLIGNAIKFTKKGSISIVVEAKKLTSKYFRITFSVIDTGIGIPKDKTDKIFEEFRQASGDVTVKYGGTGLGLSISKKLVEMHNGELMVKSETGKGSVFYFTLDLEGKEISTDITMQEKASFDEIKKELTGKKLKILVAEDNKLNQILIKKILVALNMSVSLAENGKEAIEILEKEAIDLILMDIQMPVMDGYQATEHIRTHFDNEPDKKNIPIIALSAAVTEAEREKAKHLGMNFFIPKPFKEEEIIETIKNAIK